MKSCVWAKTKGAQISHDVDDLSGADLYLMYYKNSNSFGIRVNNGKQVMIVSKKGMDKLCLENLAKKAQKESRGWHESGEGSFACEDEGR